MKSRTKRRRRRTQQEVDALLDRFQSSEMTIRAFCQAEGIAESVLYRRLREHRGKPTPGLVEVKPPLGIGGCFTVATPRGYRIEIPANFRGEDLQRLVSALEP